MATHPEPSDAELATTLEQAIESLQSLQQLHGQDRDEDGLIWSDLDRQIAALREAAARLRARGKAADGVK